jgi:hypothetical protein
MKRECDPRRMAALGQQALRGRHSGIFDLGLKGLICTRLRASQFRTARAASACADLRSPARFRWALTPETWSRQRHACLRNFQLRHLGAIRDAPPGVRVRHVAAFFAEPHARKNLVKAGCRSVPNRPPAVAQRRWPAPSPNCAGFSSLVTTLPSRTAPAVGYRVDCWGLLRAGCRLETETFLEGWQRSGL